MKIKTSELDGVTLDWAVAKCEGFEIVNLKHGRAMFIDPADDGALNEMPINYSTDWSLGGPIIERERISVWFEKHDDVDCGLPIWFAQDGYAPAMQGSTPLIAAMRCYVAGMLGDEVEVPDCLIEVNHE